MDDSLERRRDKWHNIYSLSFCAAIGAAFIGGLVYTEIQTVRRDQAISKMFDEKANPQRSFGFLSKNGFSDEQAKRYPACYKYYGPKNSMERIALNKQMVRKVQNCLVYN